MPDSRSLCQCDIILLILPQMRTVFRFITSISLFVGAFLPAQAQINTDQVLKIGRNALYFEDYLVSIQYFNQVIQAKPYMAQPYLYRAIAKLNLEDYLGAEADASLAIERNPFIPDSWEVRGVARQNLKKDREAIDDYTQLLTLVPENRNILFNKAMALSEIKEFDEAKATLNHLIDVHPGFDNAYLGRARVNVESGDSLAALADIAKTLSLNPDATNAYIIRAEIAMRSPKIAEADSTITKAMADFPADERCYRQALADLDHAIRLEPKLTGLFINRAYLRYRLDDYYGAMADYDYAIQLEPNNTTALFNRGLLRAETLDNNRAIEDFSKVLSINPNEHRSLYNRAILYQKINNNRAAIADLTKIIDAYPSFAGAYFMRYSIYRSMGNLAKAESDYNRAMAVSKKGHRDKKKGKQNEPNDIPEPEIDETDITAKQFTTLLTVENTTDINEEYNTKGIRGKVQDKTAEIEIEKMFVPSFYAPSTELKESAYFMREIDEINASRELRRTLLLTSADVQLTDEATINSHFESIEYYNSYIATHAHRAIDFFARAMDFITLRNYDAAITDLNRAIELTPDFALAYFVRAIATVKNRSSSIPASSAGGISPQNNGLRNAIADLDQAIKLSPRNPFAYFNKGNLLVEAQDYTSAIAAYSKAIEIKPDLGEAYFNRGFVYLTLGNRQLGLPDISKSGELGIVPSYNLLKRMK